MIGDKLLVTAYHRQAAERICQPLLGLLQGAAHPLAVSVAGESGCGKSETAAVLAEAFQQKGFAALILQQDDYFFYPPATNHRRRLEDIARVGPGEVHLDLLDQHLSLIRSGREKDLEKPLVHYKEDRIAWERVSLEGIRVVIAEGTYTTLLENLDLRSFIDRNYHQTRKARLDRSREKASAFLEEVLDIEHRIIAPHRHRADVIIPPPAEEDLAT